MTGGNARALAMRLATAVPLVWIAWRLISVLLDPGSDASRPWLENATTLLGLELALLVATPVAVYVAQLATEGDSVAVPIVITGLVALGIHWMWQAFGASPVFWVLASLLVGRYITGVLGTPELRFDFYERAMAGGAVFVAANVIVFIVILMPAGANGPGDSVGAIATLALHYSVLAVLELPGIYRRWQEPVFHRPSLLIEKPMPTGGRGTRLVFARDTLEVFEDWRPRPALLAVLAGAWVLFLVILPGFVPEFVRESVFRRPVLMYAAFAFAAVAGIAWILRRDYIDWRITQIRHHELTEFGIQGNAAVGLRTLTDREIESIGIVPESRAGPYVGIRLRNAEPMRRGWARIELCVELEPLRDLFVLYFNNEVTPQVLQQEIERNAALAAMLGPELVAHLLAPQRALPGSDQIACPQCRTLVWSSAPRCRGCGLAYPGLGAR